MSYASEERATRRSTWKGRSLRISYGLWLVLIAVAAIVLAIIPRLPRISHPILAAIDPNVIITLTYIILAVATVWIGIYWAIQSLRHSGKA